jgi:hypothetical protein
MAKEGGSRGLEEYQFGNERWRREVITYGGPSLCSFADGNPRMVRGELPTATEYRASDEVGRHRNGVWVC